MKNHLRIFTLIFIGVICFSLTGCGTFTEDDALTLVKGDLDSIYKNINSEEYLSLCQTTESERAAIHEATMKSAADAFIYYFDFDESMMSQSTYDRVVRLYKDMYGMAKYEVTSVATSDDKFLVSVTVYPMDIYEKVINEDYDAFLTSYQEMYYGGMGNAELEQYYQDGVLDLFESRLSSFGYLNPVPVTLNVIPSEEDGTVYYSVDQNDFYTLDTYVISQDF
jgi:hypothetical protein